MFPDHLDAHKNIKEYINAKANIARFQKKEDKVFYFETNKYSKWIAHEESEKKISVTAKDGENYLHKLKILGAHNAMNAAIAAKVSKSLGISQKIIDDVISNYKGLEHRLELVRVLHKIYFYNDSGSTNPQTTIAAIKSFETPLVPIIGGKDKNLDYKDLKKVIINSKVVAIVLVGENKNKIAKSIEGITVPVLHTTNFEEAIREAARAAHEIKREHGFALINVVLTPGSTSFDLFQNYKERGKAFKKIVKSLKD